MLNISKIDDRPLLFSNKYHYIIVCMFQSDTYLCMAIPVPTTQDSYIGEYIFFK